MPDSVKSRPVSNIRPEVPEQATHSTAFQEVVRRIRKSGPITFAEFMDVALYWPDGGYYTSSSNRWGEGGDYITNLDTGGVFARVLAKMVHEMWLVLGSPGDFQLIEIGAGRGLLSIGILEAVEERYPELFETIKVSLVEKNPNLRGVHPGRPDTRKAGWYEDIEEVGPGITGCIISNELFDSLPVHRLVQRQTLKELYVGFRDGALVDIEGELSNGELLQYIDNLGIRLKQGQTVEVGLRAGDFIRKIGALVKMGFVVTIDYGLPARELYSTERKGTLLCHWRHTLNDEPYSRVGLQDITAHADFTTLVKEGAKAGLDLTGFTLQRHFLMGLGILEELEEVTGRCPGEVEKLKHNQSIKQLILPGGMGDTFKVLVQHKGLDGPELKGFSFKDLSRHLCVQS